MREKDKRLNYVVDETILCYHGPLLYEAKVLKAEFWENDGKKDSENYGPHYFIHYKGWNVKWDDWVPESRTLKWNPENLKKQAELEETISPSGRRSSIRFPDKGRRSFEGAGRKRRRDSTFTKSPEEPDMLSTLPNFVLTISEELKERLQHDRQYVVENHALVPIPRTPSISQILTDYFHHVHPKGTASPSALDETKTLLLGLKLYFNTALPNILLYRSERPQYSAIMKRVGPNKQPADIYGAEHFLRLFVRLPVLVARAGADEAVLDVLVRGFNGVLQFIDDRRDKYLVKEYEPGDA